MQVPDVAFPENIHTPKSVNHDLLNYRTTEVENPVNPSFSDPSTSDQSLSGTRSVHRFTRDDQAAWSHEPFIVR